MSISNILQKLNSRNTKLFPQFSKLNKKIKFASILIAFIFLSFLGHQILAEDLTIDNSATQQLGDVFSAGQKGNNLESWSKSSITSNAVGFAEAIGGTQTAESLTALANGETSNLAFGGLLGITNNAIASLYNPPVSGVQYIAQSFNNFLGKPAYAANGYDGLKGIQNIWKSFRNAVYILFSIIFIGIGIAIMLRVKISQNAVITIQSAIPQLITSLILVTFSFAIAGLLIDASYLFSGLVLAIIFNSQNGINSPLLSGTNPLTFSGLMQAGFGTTFGLLYKLLPISIIGTLTTIIGGTLGALFIPLGPAGWVGGAISGVVGAALGFFLIIVFIFIQTVKFFIGLAKCYINILFRVIFAPLEIGMGAIPNSKMNFSSWIWNIVANLAVFPVSIIFLVLVNLILELMENNSSSLWAPPMLNHPTILRAIIGICAYMMLAKLPSLIPEAVFNIKPSPWGKALGESFKAGPISKLAGRGALQKGAALNDEQLEAYKNAKQTPPKWRQNIDIVKKTLQSADIIK